MILLWVTASKFGLITMIPDVLVAVFSSIQLIARAAEMLAVDHRLRLSPAGFQTGGVLPLKLLCAGCQQDELGEIPVENRQASYLARLVGCRHIGAVRFQERCLSRRSP